MALGDFCLTLPGKIDRSRVKDKMGRSAQERQVSPDVLWVNSLRMMLPLAQPTAQTSIK